MQTLANNVYTTHPSFPEITFDTATKQLVVNTAAPLNKTFYVTAQSTSYSAVRRQEVHI